MLATQKKQAVPNIRVRTHPILSCQDSKCVDVIARGECDVSRTGAQGRMIELGPEMHNKERSIGPNPARQSIGERTTKKIIDTHPRVWTQSFVFVFHFLHS
jgi:hypothetical protein